MNKPVFATAAEALVYATECHLATQEQALRRKSTSQVDRRRLASIAETLIEHCRRFATPQDAHRIRCPRVEDLLESAPDALAPVAEKAVAPLKVVNLRWALEGEKQAKLPPSVSRYHREGVAYLENADRLPFCGRFHATDCDGRCDLPRLFRMKDGIKEYACVAMGLCPVFNAEQPGLPWRGSEVEVVVDGNPNWW